MVLPAASGGQGSRAPAQMADSGTAAARWLPWGAKTAPAIRVHRPPARLAVAARWPSKDEATAPAIKVQRAPARATVAVAV